MKFGKFQFIKEFFLEVIVDFINIVAFCVFYFNGFKSRIYKDFGLCIELVYKRGYYVNYLLFDVVVIQCFVVQQVFNIDVFVFQFVEVLGIKWCLVFGIKIKFKGLKKVDKFFLVIKCKFICIGSEFYINFMLSGIRVFFKFVGGISCVQFKEDVIIWVEVGSG